MGNALGRRQNLRFAAAMRQIGYASVVVFAFLGMIGALRLMGA